MLLRHGGLVSMKENANPKHLGDPVNGMRMLDEKHVDELMVLSKRVRIQFLY